MLLFHHSGFHERKNFGKRLNEKGLTGVGVEVGTHRGEFASLLLKEWAGKLYAVDHWLSNYHPKDPAAKGDREADFAVATEITKKYQGRMRVVRAISSQAVEMFDAQSLDFVYIDANHSFKSVVEDLGLWWPKIRTGGWLAGHDIICPGEPNGWSEDIQKAVMQFAIQYQRTIYLVPETLAWPWSFYLVK